MYSYEVNYTYTIHFQYQTIHRTFTFVIYHWKSLKNIHYWLQKKKKIKILTGIETYLVSWVAGGGCPPCFHYPVDQQRRRKAALCLDSLYIIPIILNIIRLFRFFCFPLCSISYKKAAFITLQRQIIMYCFLFFCIFVLLHLLEIGNFH